MNYKVLYRKYRPSNFSEIVGQKNTIKLLQDSIISNKVAHAYIFSGPRGTGKTSTAKIFAKTLNCLNLIDGNPCDQCEQCLNFINSSDIYEIDAASNNGVDQIREIVDNIKLLPIHSKYKIYIIDEVHMLSTSAFNALLLTLEEPPSHVVFILATTNIEAVPITILSRCQRLIFKKISTTDIVENMKMICSKEEINITDEALNEIALYSDGGMRDALSVLDQLSKLNETIDINIVQKELGFISNVEYEKLITCVEKGTVDDLISIIDNFKNNSIDFKLTIKKLITILKNKCIDVINGKNNNNLSFYKNLCFELAETLNNISVNIDSYDLLELIMLNQINPNPVNKVVPSHSKEENSNQININEEKENNNKISTKKIEKPVDNINPDSLVKIRVNNCFVDANKEYLNKYRPLWDEFIKNNDNKKMKTILNSSNVVLASNKIIILVVDMLDQSENINDEIEFVESEFNSMFNLSYKLICLDKLSWEAETNKYKEMMKQGKKYTFIEENQKNEIDINDVFDTSVVEII